MGKRKHKDAEAHLERKIRKLERKMAKIRRRRYSYSSSCSSNNEHDLITEETVDNVLSSEVEQIRDTTYYEDVVPDVALETTYPSPETSSEHVADAEVPLEENILNILGDEPAKEESFSASIHKDIAVRWSEVLLNGLNEDSIKGILKSYDVPENLKLALPPLLNPEIKAAVSESFIKRDDILIDKQKHLACAISCIASLISNMLNDKAVNSNNQATIELKQLSDAGRVLCHLHNSETNTRKQFLLSALSKNIKDNIKDQKRDQWLFGAELSEKLRSMKAISKTGAEMKATPLATIKQNAPFRNRQPEASTSRALNWRAPPPPPPRPAATRSNSTAGGRGRQPATAQRRAPPPARRTARTQHHFNRRR